MWFACNWMKELVMSVKVPRHDFVNWCFKNKVKLNEKRKKIPNMYHIK